MKKIISAILCATLIFGILPMSVYAAFGEESISIGFTNERYGNLYFGDERPHISVRLSNKTKEDVTTEVLVSAEPKDGIGTSYELTSTAEAKARTSYETVIKTDENFKYGIYTLTVSVSMNNEVLKTQSFDVSVAPKVDERVEDILIQTHFETHLDSANAAEYITKNIGACGIRDTHRWEYVEQNAGVLKVVEGTDKKINQMSASGDDIILTLGMGNSLYDVNQTSKEASFPTTDDGIEAFANYCEFMARAYKGKIDKFEIWNEPNTPNFTGGTVVEPEDYAKVLKAVYPRIKNANPEAEVIAGGLTSIQNKRGSAGTASGEKYPRYYYYDSYYPNGVKIYDTFYWFKLLIEETDALDYMDSFSFHLYHNNDLYLDETGETLKTITASVTKVFENAGKYDFPLYITEYGKSSTKEASSYCTENEQAEALTKTLIAAKALPQIKNVSIYNLREKGTGTDTEANFGITNGDYSAKPALLAVSQMNKMTGNTEFKESLTRDDSGDRKISMHRFCYKGSVGEEDTFVLWRYSDCSEASVRLEYSDASDVSYSEDESGTNAVIMLPTGYAIEVYDLYGNLKDGTEFILTQEPVYIRCFDASKKEISIGRNENTVTVTGTTKEPKTEVTAIIKATGSNELLYLNQQASDKLCGFEFNCEIPENGFYYVYLFDGSKKNETDNIYDFLFNARAEIFVNGVKTKEVDIKNLKDSDSVKIKLTTDANVENLMLLGALYGESGVMQSVDFKEGEAAELEMSIKDSEKVSSLKFFLWDKLGLSPFTLPIEFK